MKNIWILLLLAAAACAAQKPEPDLVLYVHAGTSFPDALGMAEARATRMLSAAGISVEWRMGKPVPRGNAEVIEVLLTAPAVTVEPGALAYAVLGVDSGTRIEVFYNRILQGRREGDIPMVLSYVLVHEITHILEGVKRHSDAGIMKAHWDTSDYARMRVSGIPFAAEDLHMIQAWIDQHHRILVAGVR